jgi:predicted dehydrogenase/flavin reductase (DIM6/NTAB) family NADH-FMN oxidoreductase RutF
VELYASATFSMVSTDPARVAVNPNRAYAISDAIEKQRQYSINVMSFAQRSIVSQLVRLRRREANKSGILDVAVQENGDRIPYIPAAQQTLFCEVEDRYQHGDRYIYVSRILETRDNPDRGHERPLLFSELSEDSSTLRRWAQVAASMTGATDLIKSVKARIRPEQAANIKDMTYKLAGASEDELSRIRLCGLIDASRRLKPPAAPATIVHPLGVCVVGTSWGFEHCQSVRRAHPEARLYVCGRDPRRTARVARASKADGHFLGMEAAFADDRIDAVCLALPHDLHRPAVEAALSAGKHVLVEKPIAITLEDADAMIAAAKQSGKVLMVAENMHFRPAVHQAVERINAGDIGEPLYLLVHAGGVLRPQGWKQDQTRMGGGVVMDIGVHYVRALRMIMGEPDSVYASRAMQVNTRLEGEDSAQLLFSSKAGWEAHMLLSWASHRGTLPDMVVTGTAGTLALWPTKSYIEYYPVAPTAITRVLAHVRPYWLRARLTRPQWQRKRIALSGVYRSAYVAQMHEFLACIAEGRAPASPPEDARRDLEIVGKCYESFENRASVSIRPL